MEWDGQNPARAEGEWLPTKIRKAAALPAPHVSPQAQEFKSADGWVDWDRGGN
jgi:hypothetical protein